MKYNAGARYFYHLASSWNRLFASVRAPVLTVILASVGSRLCEEVVQRLSTVKHLSGMSSPVSSKGEDLIFLFSSQRDSGILRDVLTN